MTRTNPKVDEFLAHTTAWHEEMKALRKILLEAKLTEDFKWKQPCYTFEGSNIVIIGGFKAYVVLGFFKGVLLKDRHGLLEVPGDHSQSVRQLRFNSVEAIESKKAMILDYLREAIEVETSGLKVEKQDQTLELVQELIDIFDDEPEFKAAFEALTPGRQRGYHIFFSGAKQAQTRIARIEKYRDHIFDGKGMNDCTCGLSKKMPNCDGSHKSLL